MDRTANSVAIAGYPIGDYSHETLGVESMILFDPHAALAHQSLYSATQREMIEEAIWLIDGDRPNEAKRYLQSMLEFGVDERMRQNTKDGNSNDSNIG